MYHFWAKSNNIQHAALELEKAQLQDKLKERVSDIAVQVENSLVDKYCYMEYTSVLKRNRTRALKVIISNACLEIHSFQVLFLSCTAADQLFSRLNTITVALAPKCVGSKCPVRSRRLRLTRHIASNLNSVSFTNNDSVSVWNNSVSNGARFATAFPPPPPRAFRPSSRCAAGVITADRR